MFLLLILCKKVLVGILSGRSCLIAGLRYLEIPWDLVKKKSEAAIWRCFIYWKILRKLLFLFQVCSIVRNLILIVLVARFTKWFKLKNKSNYVVDQTRAFAQRLDFCLFLIKETLKLLIRACTF